METFLDSYITCAFWSSVDETGNPLDNTLDRTDLAPDTLATLTADCQDFYQSFSEHFIGNEAQAGHDFWLTRNRHGAGFWDRGDSSYSKASRELLTEMAHAYGECNLYVGDDGQIYC